MKNRNLTELKKMIDQGDRSIRVNGISGAARAYYISSLLVEIDRPVMIVLPSASEANRFYRELEFFLPESFVSSPMGERRLYDFPVYDISPLTGLSPHKNVVTRRIQSLYTMTSKNDPVVVTSIEAALLKILPKSALINSLELLLAEEEVDREALIKRLEMSGYIRTSLVEGMGDYSVRGGVVDIFPPLYSDPVRLEFWGDR